MQALRGVAEIVILTQSIVHKPKHTESRDNN